MKKTALILKLILALSFLLMVGAQFVNLAEANPYWWDITPSGTIPTKITILSPKNHTTYSSDDLKITVHITKPETPSTTKFSHSSVSLFLDGIRIDSISDYIPRSADINTVLHDPFTGNHKLEVKASYSFTTIMRLLSVESASTVFFIIENTPSSPSPSPSPLSTPPPEPTSSPYEVGVQNTSQYLAIGGMVAFTVIAFCIGLGLVLYVITRK